MGSAVRYPWERWFKKIKFILRRGRDYECKSYSMAMLVRQRARRRHIVVKVVIEEDSVSVEQKGFRNGLNTYVAARKSHQ